MNICANFQFSRPKYYFIYYINCFIDNEDEIVLNYLEKQAIRENNIAAEITLIDEFITNKH